MKKRVKTVIFDVGGVLAIPKKDKTRVHETIANKLKISVDQWMDSIDSVYCKSFHGTISKKEVLDFISHTTKTKKTKLKKIITQTYLSQFKQNKQLFKQAFKLKKQGYKIAVFSDQWHFSKEPMMPKKYYKNFDVVLASCDEGLRKPFKEFFKLLFKKTKSDPSQCILIDNQHWNIAAAKKIGMKTIHYKNNKQTIQKLNDLI